MAAYVQLFDCLVIWEWNYLRRIWGCGFVGAGVAVIEEVCHWLRSLRFQNAKSGPVSFSLFLLPPDLGVEMHSYSYSTGLPVLSSYSWP